MIPACGPPSSLSPLMTTSVAPAPHRVARRRLAAQPDTARATGASRCRGRCSSGSPASRASGARSRSVASATKPRTSKLLRCTFTIAPVSGADRAPVVVERACGSSCRLRASGAPLFAMMSGTRKLPPISISSPRETIDSLAVGERVEREHQRRRAVVDDERVFGAGQLAEQRRAVHVARAALAAARRRIRDCDAPAAVRAIASTRGARQRRAPEVRVQHDAGRVEDGAQGGLRRARRARRGSIATQPLVVGRRRAPSWRARSTAARTASMTSARGAVSSERPARRGIASSAPTARQGRAVASLTSDGRPASGRVRVVSRGAAGGVVNSACDVRVATASRCAIAVAVEAVRRSPGASGCANFTYTAAIAGRSPIGLGTIAVRVSRGAAAVARSWRRRRRPVGLALAVPAIGAAARRGCRARRVESALSSRDERAARNPARPSSGSSLRSRRSASACVRPTRTERRSCRPP